MSTSIPGIASESALAFNQQFQRQFILLAADKSDDVTPLFSTDPSFSAGQEVTWLHYMQAGSGAKDVTMENQAIQPSSIPLQRRGYSPGKVFSDYILDNFTTWKMVADPTSGYAERLVQDLNLKRRERGLAAIFDDVLVQTVSAVTGQTSVTTSAFPSANQVLHNFVGIFGQTGVTGLSFDKLYEVRRLLYSNFTLNIGETPVVLIDEEVFQTMIAQTIDVGADNILPALDLRNKLNSGIETTPGSSFTSLGYKFVFTYGLQLDASGYKRCPVFLPSGMKKGMGPKVTEMRKPDHLVDSKVLIATEINGFIRSEDQKVFEIKVEV